MSFKKMVAKDKNQFNSLKLSVEEFNSKQNLQFKVY